MKRKNAVEFFHRQAYPKQFFGLLRSSAVFSSYFCYFKLDCCYVNSQKNVRKRANQQGSKPPPVPTKISEKPEVPKMHMLITSLQVPICFVSILDFWACQKKRVSKTKRLECVVFLMGFFSSLQSTRPT